MTPIKRIMWLTHKSIHVPKKKKKDPRMGSEPHSQEQKAIYNKLGGIKCIHSINKK